MRKHRCRQRQNRPLQVLLHPVQQSRLFIRRDRKTWPLRQQRCLEVAPRPAMSAWSTRRVGLIDITVGNAARLGASQRSTTRRCASHHIATQRASRWGHPGVSRAFSAYTPVAPRRSCEADEFAASRRDRTPISARALITKGGTPRFLSQREGQCRRSWLELDALRSSGRRP
jgi:hypothetical protein